MHERRRYGEIGFGLKASVRPCREVDLPALEWMGLFSAHAALLRNAFMAQERGEALLLLAVRRGFPLAQVFIDFVRRREHGAALFWAIRTFPPLQGAGIGTRMLQAAEAAAHERGFQRAELGVERSNQAALRFYERHGWRRLGRFEEVVAHDGGPGEELRQWLMEKQLERSGRVPREPGQ